MVSRIRIIAIVILIIIGAVILIMISDSTGIMITFFPEPIKISTIEELVSFQCDGRTQYVIINLNGFDGRTEGKDSLTVACLNKQTNQIQEPPSVCTPSYCVNIQNNNCEGAITTSNADFTQPFCQRIDIFDLRFIVGKSNEIISQGGVPECPEGEHAFGTSCVPDSFLSDDVFIGTLSLF